MYYLAVSEIKVPAKLVNVGYLIVIHKAAVNLATFVAFLIGVDGRILLTRRGFSPLTKTFTN